jgi:hypothetical protein
MRSRPSATTTLNVNVRGLIFTVQKALPLMADAGTIILT